MSSVKRQRRAFAPEQYEQVRKSAEQTIERTKVWGMLERDPDGSVYLTKMDEEQAVLKPFAGYKDFDACVADQLSKGKSQSSAEKICGYLKHRTEKAEEPVEETVEWYCPIVKADEEGDERLVMGIVLEPETVDLQKDIYDADVIKAAAHDFLREYNAGTVVGFMHKDMNRALEVVESWIAPADMTIASTKIKKGTWLMTVHVSEEAIWKSVKEGKIAGFSIGGLAKVQPVDATKAA